MKKLPKIYQNEEKKRIHNNKEVAYLKNIEKVESIIENKVVENNVEEIIQEIFYGIGHPYNIPVLIKTKDNLLDTYLIAKDRNNVVTIENKVIPINEILYLKRKN